MRSRTTVPSMLVTRAIRAYALRLRSARYGTNNAVKGAPSA